MSPNRDTPPRDHSSLRKLRRESDRIRIEIATAAIDRTAAEPKPQIPTDDDYATQAKAIGIHLRPTVRQKARDNMLALFAAADTGRKAATVERKSAAPVQIAEFEC